MRQPCVYEDLFLPSQRCLTPPLGVTPAEFLDETYPAKTTGMGLLHVENCMILASTIFEILAT